MLRPRSEWGEVHHKKKTYGTSAEGTPLTVWLPIDQNPEILVMASIHGDEAETTVVVSDALRSITSESLVCAVILCANPDGMMRGTRANAHGVDLNRNLPCSNWSPDPVYYKNKQGEPQDIRLGTGTHAGSEPETKALLALLKEIKPKAVISLHAALACIDDADASSLGLELAKRSGLPLVDGVGYTTLGSFGSWASEHGMGLITYELEADSPNNLRKKHVSIILDVLTGVIRA